jgi:hypothetical protein
MDPYRKKQKQKHNSRYVKEILENYGGKNEKGQN